MWRVTYYCVTDVLGLCSTNNVGVDTSPKAVRPIHRKAPAPPPPPFISPHTAAKPMAGHLRSPIAEAAGALSPCERPCVPPPAPPKIQEELNVDHGMTQADGTKSENSGLPVDDDLRLGTQSANTSGVSEIGELSWSSESDQSYPAAAAQPAEDIRKMKAQLKEQWWHNSPTLGDRSASKMAVEISGRFNRRVSPSKPCDDSEMDGKLEKDNSENDVHRAQLESVEVVKSDDSDENPDIAYKKSDVVDGIPDYAVDECRTADDADVERQQVISDSQTFETGNGELENLQDEPAVDKIIASPPPIPSPRPSLTADHDTGKVVTECIRETAEQAALSSEAAASTSIVSAPVTRPKPLRSSSMDGASGHLVVAESTHGKEVFGQASLSVEMTPTSPTTSAPPVRPKPPKSPPARPPPVSPSNVHSDTCPPLVLRKPSADGKSRVPESPAEPPTTPLQADLPPKSRTQDRVEPTKPEIQSNACPAVVFRQPSVDGRPRVFPQIPTELPPVVTTPNQADLPAKSKTENRVHPEKPEVQSDTSPPVVLRKSSVEDGPHIPDVPVEHQTAVTTPTQADLPPKSRTQEKVRPEKPPPPLPRSLPSQMSEPAAESQGDMDSSDNAAMSDEVALHDEDTYL